MKTYKEFKEEIKESVDTDWKHSDYDDTYATKRRFVKPEDYKETAYHDYEDKGIHGKTNKLIHNVTGNHLERIVVNKKGDSNFRRDEITNRNSDVAVKPASSRMWTRGDGSRYKDESHIHGPEGHIGKIWDHLQKHGKSLGTTSGEFRSDPKRNSIEHNGVIYSKHPDDKTSIAYTSKGRTSPVWDRQNESFDFDAELMDALFESGSDVSHPEFNPKGVPVRLNVKRDIKTGKLLSTAVAQQSVLNKDKYYNDSHNVSNDKDVDNHINYIKKAVKAGMSVHHTAPDNTDEKITPQNVDAVTNSIKTAHKGTVPTEYANRQANLPPKKPRDTKYDLGGDLGPGNRSPND